MRRYEPFAFKHFRVHQQESAMKVGTDGVLLGACTDLPSLRNPRILDIGSGTGLVGMMLAQRLPGAHVVCVEVDEAAVKESRRSIEESIFVGRIEVYHTDFGEEFDPEEGFDLIVSNPPFFTSTHSAEGERRNRARHIGGLSPDILFKRAAKMLNRGGTITLISAVSTFTTFAHAAEGVGLHLHKVLHIYPTPTSSLKRIIATWQQECPTTVTLERLIIERRRHIYSEEFAALTADFYPHLER